MRIILFEKKIRSSLIFLQLLLFVSESALRLFCTCALLNFEYFFDNFQKFIGICCLWVNWFWCSQTGILKVCVICLTGCQIIVILLIISCRVAMQNCLVAKKVFSATAWPANFAFRTQFWVLHLFNCLLLHSTRHAGICWLSCNGDISVKIRKKSHK